MGPAGPKGKDGKDGKPGKDGKDGKPGRDGRDAGSFSIGGMLVSHLSDVYGGDAATDGQALVWDNAVRKWHPGSIAGAGETNTASNQGAGVGLAMTKVGVDLPFKTLVAGTNITLTPSTNTVTIDATGGGGVSDGDKGDVVVSSSGTVWTIDSNSVDNTKLSDVATSTFKGRITGGSGDPEDLSVAQAKTLLNLTGTNSGDQTITLTTDVTGSGTGSFATTIANNAVTNAKAADMGANTIKGNNTGGSADPIDLSVAQVQAMLGTSGTNTGDVTLAGSPTYITIAGQVITRNAVDLTSHVTGDLPLSSLAQSAAASRLLGRGSAGGAGDYEPITVGGALSFSGTVLSATDTNTLGPDGDKGDVTVGGTGTTLTIDNNAVTYAKMQDVSATNRFLGRITAGAGDTEELTGTQATSLLDLFSTSTTTKGLVPGSNGVASTNFLNASGAWSVPAGGSADGLGPDGDKGDVTVGGTGTTLTIDNDAVTYAKMQNISAASLLLGRGSAGGAGDPQEITLGTNLSMSGTTLNATGGGGGLTQGQAVAAIQMIAMI
jgi:hypothetical protein